MKKNYMLLTALLLLSFTFLGSRAFAYNIVSHSETDSCGGMSTFLVYVNSNSTALSVETYYGDGTGAFSTPIYGTTSPYTFKSHTYAISGTYTVKHILKLSGVPVDSVQFSFSTYCQFVRFSLYADNNSNCVFDSGDGGVGTAQIEIDSAGVKIDTVTVWGSGFARLTSGKTYSFKLLNPPLGATASCPTSGVITQTLPYSSTVTDIKFGVQCGVTSQFDLAVAINGRYRPVDTSRIDMMVLNNACSSHSGTVTLNISPKYTFARATIAPTSVSGNTVTWTLSAVPVWGTQIYAYVVPATTSINVGDTICSNVSATPTTGDANVANNYASSCDTVRTSFDPNEKSVEPRGNISPGTKLTYRIDFENTGNDTAFNIRVLDTLSNNLDANTFAVQYSSHPVTSNLENGPAGSKVARFDFNNIKLADSNHKDANKGFVIFTINAKKILAPSTVIPNKAGIYFDINDVVMTNTVSNMIHPVGVAAIEKQTSAIIYPNPVHGVLSIKVSDGQYETARLLNALGQVLVSAYISGEHTLIDVKALTPGIYYLELKGSAGFKVEKIEKQ